MTPYPSSVLFPAYCAFLNNMRGKVKKAHFDWTEEEMIIFLLRIIQWEKKTPPFLTPNNPTAT